MIITRTDDEYAPDIKRLRAPYIIKDNCPECKNEIQRDLRDGTCLEYANFEMPEDIFGYCDECEHEWPLLIKVDIIVSECE